MLTPRCHAHRGMEFFRLCDRISSEVETEFENTGVFFIPKHVSKISGHCPFKASQKNNNFKTLDQNRHLVTYWLCVRCTLRSLTWRWDARRAVFLDTLFSRQSLTLLYGAHLRVWLRGMMQTAETDYCMWYDAHCRVSKKFEYLGEIETEFEKTYVKYVYQRPRWVRIKKYRSKISWHAPFKVIVSLSIQIMLLRYFFGTCSFIILR